MRHVMLSDTNPCISAYTCTYVCAYVCTYISVYMIISRLLASQSQPALGVSGVRMYIRMYRRTYTHPQCNYVCIRTYAHAYVHVCSAHNLSALCRQCVLSVHPCGCYISTPQWQ